MILRNLGLRHGRKTCSPPLQRCLFRFLTTEAPTPQVDSLENTIDPPNVSDADKPGELHLFNEVLPAQKRKPKPMQLALDWQKHSYKVKERVGAVVEPFYKPNQNLISPLFPNQVTLEVLMANQAHLGHATSLWNPMNQRYIYGVREGIHIISLEITAQHLRRAAKVVEEVAYHGGLILFVGTRKGQKDAVIKAAELADGCYIFDRWRPGAITNKNMLLAHCELKVVGLKDEEIEGYEEKLNLAPPLRPDLVVIMNPMEQDILLHECQLYNIPTIAVVDTNSDPTRVTYPIPANDDSLRCIEIIAGALGRAGGLGQERRLEDAEEGKSTWLPTEGLGLPYDGDEEKKKLAEKETGGEKLPTEADFVEPVRKVRRSGRDDDNEKHEDEDGPLEEY